MPRPRKRPTFYSAAALPDGTVLAAHPIRKPHARIMRERGWRIDADGVVIERTSNGKDLSDTRIENRSRFQDRVTDSLNMRRAVRAVAMPAFAEVRDEVAALREEVAKLRAALADLISPPPP